MSQIEKFVIFLFFCTVIACTTDYRSKPKGYNRFVLPDPVYIASPDTLPYRFEYSSHAMILPDTSPIRDDSWIEILYPDLSAVIHITYKPLDGSISLLKSYLKDTYTLASKHQIKAYAIDEMIVQTPQGKTALIVVIDGETPSQLQFSMTDSSRHFLRGALYFKLKVQNDSLRPAIEYVKKDMMHLINTLEWNN